MMEVMMEAVGMVMVKAVVNHELPEAVLVRGRFGAGLDTGAIRRIELENPVTLQEMENGIVDTGAYSRYCNEIIHFVTRIRENEVSWLTKYGKGKMDELVVLREDKRANKRRKHIKEAWMEMLQNAKQTPILDIGSITPARVVEGYILKQAN
jgi:hypothetical protein